MIDVFISHTVKDATIAEQLIALLRMALNLRADQIRCTSVDGYRLSAGANTNDQLRQEVHEAKTLIGIITQESLQSAYVLFELGARWGANRHLVPLLAASTSPTTLVGPLSVLNALSCDSNPQIYQLVADLAQELNIPNPNPQSYLRQIENLIRASNDRVLKGAPMVMIYESIVCGETVINNERSFAHILIPVTILNETEKAIVQFTQITIPPNSQFPSERHIININNPQQWDLLRRAGSLLPGAAVTGLLMFISDQIPFRTIQEEIMQENFEFKVQCTDVRGFTHSVLPRIQPPNVPGAAFRIGIRVTERSNSPQAGPSEAG